ncbi:glycosyltransferase family 4 protein [Candidatus Roizmanbacteria bacterium]|nr:glycosyltransferase family 4 protein [Candidatus Roizmanbacteria bacterium]
MKVAIVSYGHIDSILPLAKRLAEKVQLDLYICVYGEKFTESIGSFDLSPYSNGIHDESVTIKLLGGKVCDYVNDSFRIFLLKFPDLKVKNIENIFISYEFAKYLNDQKYDIVHFNGIKLTQFIIAFFLKRKNVLWTIHDPFLHTGEERFSTTVLYKTIGFLGPNVVVHNKFWIKDFMRTYSVNPRNVFYVRHGTMEIYRSFCERDYNPDPQKKTLLFFGRISKYKGLEYLVKAAIKSKNRVPNLKVVIAGEGKYCFDTSLIENNDLFECHNRYIGNEELVELIQKCDVVVCPYIDATQSGVVLTAFALNKPVIASAVGGIPEVVIPEVTGKLVPPKDEDALSDAIVDMLSDPEKLKNMSENIKKQFISGEFSWEMIRDQMLDIYKTTLRS